MKRIFLFVTILVLFSISSVSAQFLGQLSAAPTVEKGSGLLGAYLGVYDNAFSVFGQFRYGVMTYVDLGLKMGIINYDPENGESNSGLAFGGDIKYWFMEKHSGDPLDLSFGIGTEYLSISDFSVFSLGGNVIASYPIEYNETKKVTPYGRLNVRWERANDSDMDVALAIGADLKLNQTLNLIGELEIDDNVGFVAGVNWFVF